MMPGTEWTAAHAKKLRAVRERLGISQFKLAKLADVDSSVVSKYENELRHPRAIVLYRICQALGVSMEVIIEAGLNSGDPPSDRAGRLRKKGSSIERSR